MKKGALIQLLPRDLGRHRANGSHPKSTIMTHTQAQTDEPVYLTAGQLAQASEEQRKNSPLRDTAEGASAITKNLVATVNAIIAKLKPVLIADVPTVKYEPAMPGSKPQDVIRHETEQVGQINLHLGTLHDRIDL